MLTIRGPIQLNIGKGLAVTSDSFCQRLLGNYDLLAAHCTPKDLLLLMTAPPDLSEQLGGGMTSITVEHTAVDARRISVDVVNHMVNRILLDGSSGFTYQDQVYITTVLNRLGVTNVEQFMQQLRQMRTENESVVRLTELYRSELNTLTQRQSAGQSGTPPLLVLPNQDTEETLEGAGAGLTLHTEILKRLDSLRIYETVHAFQRSYTAGGTMFRQSELRLAEQLRIAQALTLSQTKRQLFQAAPITLLRHTNRYETGELLPPPQNEEAVLAQATVAALVSVIDNTVVERLARPSYQSSHWLQMENALYQTVENTLSRFESYHSQTAPPLPESASAAPLAHYVREFYQFQSLLSRSYPQSAAAEEPQTPPAAAPLNALLTFLSQEGDTVTVAEGLERLEKQFSQTQLNRLTRTLVEQPIFRQLHTFSEQTHRSLVTTPGGEGGLTFLLAPAGAEEIPAPPMGVPTLGNSLPPVVGSAPPSVPPPTERVLLTPREAEEHQPKVLTQQQNQLEVQNRQLHTFSEQTHQSVVTTPGGEERLTFLHTPEGEEAVPAPPMETPTLGTSLPLAGESTTPPVLPPTERVLLTPREAEEHQPELLTQRLNQLDAQNRTLVQQIAQSTLLQSTAAPRQPDVQRTLSDALRALDDPEALQRELLSRTEAAPLTHPPLTPQLEAILRQADPATRALYETVLLYEKNPEAVLAQGLLRPGTPGGLAAALKLAGQEPTPEPAELEHPGEEAYRQTQHLRERSEQVLDRLEGLPLWGKPLEKPAAPPPAVRIVHKQAAPDVTEEVLEQLERQKTQSVVKTETSDTILRQQTRQTEINQTEKQVVAQTTEDITELINRTLARQMRTISDQVYHQMEKRLQTERSRRGRL